MIIVHKSKTSKVQIALQMKMLMHCVMFSYTNRSSGTLRVRLPRHCRTLPLRHALLLHSSATIAALFVSMLLSHVSHWITSSCDVFALTVVLAFRYHAKPLTNTSCPV